MNIFSYYYPAAKTISRITISYERLNTGRKFYYEQE